MQWQRIGRISLRQRMSYVTLGTGGLLALALVWFVGVPVARLVLDGAALAAGMEPFSGPGATVLQLVLVAALCTAVLVIAALLHPGLEASSDGTRIRIGRRTLSAAALQHAWLGFETQAANREQLILRLEAGRVRTRLWLRAKQRVTLSDGERALLIRVLEHSSIAPPRSSYDPGGRFARYNFPGSLTKEEAIELVRDVPAPGSRLPVTD